MQKPAKRVFDFQAKWDAATGVWWCSNDELPVATEAPTFDELVARVTEIASEIATINGLVAAGEEIEIHIAAEKVQSVVAAAA